MNRSRVEGTPIVTIPIRAVYACALCYPRAFDNRDHRHGSLEHCDHLRSELYTQ